MKVSQHPDFSRTRETAHCSAQVINNTEGDAKSEGDQGRIKGTRDGFPPGVS